MMEKLNKYLRVTTISTAHASDVTCVLHVREHGKTYDTFVTCSVDGIVKLFRVERNENVLLPKPSNSRQILGNNALIESSECILIGAPLWSLCYTSGFGKYNTDLILAGSSSGNIYGLDILAKKILFILDAHTDVVCCLASEKLLGRIFVSGSFDYTAKIWIHEDSHFTLDGHTDAVLAIAFLKAFVLTGSADSHIRAWNLETGIGACEHVFSGHTSAVTGLVASSEESFLSCSCDGSVRMWSCLGGCLKVLVSTSSDVFDIVWIEKNKDFAILYDDRVQIFSDHAHLQNIEIPPNALSIAATADTIVVGSCEGALHCLRSFMEKNFVKKSAKKKESHSHSSGPTILQYRENDQKMEITSEINAAVLKTKIAIIGAGISGLSCAVKLKELGFSEVKVYEGKEEIGGRIQTLYSGSQYIDIGAQWIHGEDGNSVYQIAEKEDLVLKNAPIVRHKILSFTYLKNKKHYIKVRQLITFLEDKLEKISDDDNVSYSDESVLSYIQYHFNEYCLNCNEEMNKLLTDVFNWFVKFLCELNGCRELSNLSRKLYKSYEECAGNQAVEVKNGCSSIIDLLQKKVPPEWIVNSHTLETIDYREFCTSQEGETSEELLNNWLNRSPKIKLRFKEGKTLTYDHVILTVSVGCLKEKKINFHPELEHNKQIAIDSIGFNVVNKIYLIYEEVKWKYPVNINVLWKEHYEETFENCNTQWDWNICWPKYIHRFAYSYGNPKMLTAWIVGEGAEYIEKLGIADISFGCTKLLQMVLQVDVPTPCNIIKSSWKSDPYTCGSYSFLAIDNAVNNVCNANLAEPIVAHNIACGQHPVIQFAGEATHSSFYSTMHGAYESGIREANRLIEHYEKSSSLLSSSMKAMENISNIKNPRSILQVVVIGAGLAGLTCAWNLHQKGFKEVVILEAQNVVGGRISSMTYGDSVLELGASWLHGSDNPLYAFSSDNHLLCHPSDSPSHEGEGTFYTSNGGAVDVTIVEEIKEILNNIKAELGISNFKNQEDLKSAMDVFTSSFSSYMSNCNQNSNSDVKWGLFKWFVKFETVDNGCDSLNDVAVQSYTDWHECCDESYHINYKTGFQSVIDSLSSQIPKSVINVNMPVKSVKWNDTVVLSANKFYNMEINREFPILVQCEDGQCISADSVVITASIGFLKDNMDKFFNPTLPLIKQQALTRIGFGTINKIYLAFDEPFWNDNSHGFQLIWLDNMNNDCKKLLNENPWIYGITGFDVVRNQPNVLVAWIGGLEAKQIEDVDDITLKDVCTKLLGIFLNKKEIPSPKEIFRSYWYKNPYVRGAYSFRSCDFSQFGHSVEDFSPLCCTYACETGDKIEWPIVIFSGEATDQSAFSSAHGAFQSGLKAFQLLDDACSKIEEDFKENYCYK